MCVLIKSSTYVCISINNIWILPNCKNICAINKNASLHICIFASCMLLFNCDDNDIMLLNNFFADVRS